MILTTKNNKAMKTTLYTTVLIAAITLFSLNLNASTFRFADESYIDDIPFDTELVCEKLMIEVFQNEFQFEEEAYIDDIPFNTKSIAANYHYAVALEMDFDFNEEDYINDIPFNTEELAKMNEQNTNRISSQFLMVSCINYLF
jgi:hypothetical protein